MQAGEAPPAPRRGGGGRGALPATRPHMLTASAPLARCLVGKSRLAGRHLWGPWARGRPASQPSPRQVASGPAQWQSSLPSNEGAPWHAHAAVGCVREGAGGSRHSGARQPGGRVRVGTGTRQQSWARAVTLGARPGNVGRRPSRPLPQCAHTRQKARRTRACSVHAGLCFPGMRAGIHTRDMRGGRPQRESTRHGCSPLTPAQWGGGERDPPPTNQYVRRVRQRLAQKLPPRSKKG